jgi:hypothetical protein
MTEEQILEEVNKIYPGLGVTELKGVSVIDNGNFIYVAAHTPLDVMEDRTYWNHRYFQFTLDKWNFKRCIFQDSNVTDADHFKTAEETKEKTFNYIEHVLQRL